MPPGTPAAAERADAHIRVAWAAVMGEHPEEAARRVRAARALLGPTPPPGQEAALAVVEGHLVLLPGGPGEDGAADAADAARRAAAVAEEHGLPVVACQAWQLLGLLSRNQGFDEADACLERMLEVSERHQLAAWRTEALVRLGANAFLRTGDATRLAAARTAAGELGALALTQTVDGLLAMNAVLCGEWEKARATVDRSVDAAARVRNLSAHRYLLLADATLAAHQGRRRERDAALLRFRRVSGGTRCSSRSSVACAWPSEPSSKRTAAAPGNTWSPRWPGSANGPVCTSSAAAGACSPWYAPWTGPVTSPITGRPSPRTAPSSPGTSSSSAWPTRSTGDAAATRRAPRRRSGRPCVPGRCSPSPAISRCGWSRRPPSPMAGANR